MKLGAQLLFVLVAWPTLIALASCPPPAPPAPIPPDATDAAPLPLGDGAPTVPCQAACDNRARLCGPQQPDCVQTYAHIESARVRLNPTTGLALTCYDVADAGSVAALTAIGAGCQ